MKKFKRNSLTFKLTGEDIEAFSAKVEEQLKLLKIERQNRLRIRFSLEEALLNWRDHFGEDVTVKGDFLMRLGRPSIVLRLSGEVCNPLGNSEMEQEDWSGGLLTAAGLVPQYRYSGGENTLKIVMQSQLMNPALKMVLMILIGIAVGFFLSSAFGMESLHIKGGAAVVPFYDTWFRMLLAMSGPVILFMVMTTILNTDSVNEQGGSSWRIVARYFILSVMAGLMTALPATLLFDPEYKGITLGDYEIVSIFNGIAELIPKTMLSPIVEANTPQILLLAFVLGNALVICGSRVDALKNIVRQINMIGMSLTAWMSRLVPYAAMVLIAMQVLLGRTEILRSSWKTLILATICAFVYALIVVVYTAIKEKVSINKLLKQTVPAFVTSFKAGTLDSSYSMAESSCIKGLGIQKRFVEFGLPQGLVLYMPINVIGTIAFTIFAADIYNVDISLIWLLMAIVLSVILFVATPPVPGANLLAYIVIFDQLKIPDEALVDAMIFDILFGILANAMNQLVLQHELVLQAEQIGLLDHEKLRKEA